MNDQQLKIFFNVCETKSYSQTAKLLFISQSLVSYNIKALENDIGFKLFSRNTHEVGLTKAGEKFYDSMKVLNDMALNTIAICRAIEQAETTLSVGIIGNIFLAQAAKIFADYTHTYPGLNINIVNCRFEDSILPLINQQVNFLFVFEKEYKMYADCEYIPLYKCEPHLLVSKDHPFASYQSISTKDLQEYEVLFLETDNSGLLTKLHEAGIKLKMVPNLNTELLSINANNSLVLCPFSYGDDNNLNIVSIPVSDLPQTTRGMAYRSTDTNPLCKNFIKVLKNYKI